ncbi:MAG: hypothetical protein CMH64_03915 [Nanoarchaeota archaeon]|nr:hypothetical protein [Nanoarchaeota archaeon]|tara:strand:- start:296 stop:727 length:432 start_codon:yes stop_codon:yes gene_type:complete
MILVISVCENKLHEEEFVKPVTDLLENYKVVHYSELKEVKEDKIIICGTALKDNSYLDHLDKFSWLKNFKGKVLGICAGMQIIGKVLGKELEEDKKIGFIDNKYYLHSFKVKGFGDILEKNNFKGVLFHPEIRNKEIIKEFVD